MNGNEISVLCIDDEESIRFALDAVIESQGWKAYSAKNVKEGLDTFKESLWIPSEGEEKGSNSLQVIMIAQGALKKMSVDQMVRQWGDVDYTKVHLRLIERLQEINFNFDLYDAYIKGIKEIIFKTEQEYGLIPVQEQINKSNQEGQESIDLIT